MSQEHTFASPGPAGLAALAVACFGFGAIFLGLVKPGGYPILAAWLVGGGIVQIVVAIMELKDKNLTGGNVFLFFCAFFMFAAALSLMSKFLLLVGAGAFIPKEAAAASAAAVITWFPKPDPYVEGWCWMAGAAFLTAVTPAYAKSTSLLFLLVILVDICLWLIVGMDTGWYADPATWKPMVGYMLIFCGWIGIYLAGATVCNTAYGKSIYYVPKPLVK